MFGVGSGSRKRSDERGSKRILPQVEYGTVASPGRGIGALPKCSVGTCVIGSGEYFGNVDQSDYLASEFAITFDVHFLS